MGKKLPFVIAVCLLLLIAVPLTSVHAVSVGDYIDDGIVVDEDESYCGCCHEHNHAGIFAKISCMFCKISQFFKNLFGNAEENVEHKYVITNTKAATCQVAGYESYKCLVCQKTVTHSFAKLDHKTEVLKAVSATCTESGLSQGSRCSVCNTILVEQTIVPAFGHAYDDGIVITAPVCEKEGKRVFTCATCGDTKTETIEALEHDWEDEVIEAPTCTESGAMARVCQLCETYIEREIIPALGHAYDGGVVITEADCETDGVRRYTCANCNDAYTESIAALGHIIPHNANVVCYPYNDAQSAGCLTINFACARCSDPKSGLPYFRYEYNDYKAVIKNASGVSLYATTEEALVASKNGDTVIVGIEDTINADATVPAGVTLLIPCDNVMTGYTVNGFNPDNPSKEGSAVLYRTLTIAENATLTVNGTVLINAVTGREGGGSVIPYDNSGNYGQIRLYGDIRVGNGGLLDCAGFVENEGGTVTLESGATMYETFAMEKWRGGSYVTNNRLFTPIYERHMNNMRATLYIESGAALIGSGKMYAQNQYYYARFPQIDNTNGIIRLGEGAHVIREIDVAADRDIYSFYGDIVFDKSSLNCAGYDLETSAVTYLFDGDMTFNFYAGTITVNYNFGFLPGGIVNLYDGAAFEIVKLASWAMFDQGFYEIESTLWSEGHKYTTGRAHAVLNVYENATVQAAEPKARLLGDVVVKGGTVGSVALKTFTYSVPNGGNGSEAYPASSGSYILTLNIITE